MKLARPATSTIAISAATAADRDLASSFSACGAGSYRPIERCTIAWAWLLLLSTLAFGQQPVNVVDGNGGTASKGTVKPAGIGAIANDTSLVTALSPQFDIPAYTLAGSQKTLTTKTVSVSSVVLKAHQTVIVTMGSGNSASLNWTIACSDGTNTYVNDVSNVAQTTAYSGICRATNVAAGTYTITVTISGSASATTTMQMAVYACDGLLLPVSPLDRVNTPSAASGTALSTTAVVVPQQPYEIAFIGASVAASSTATAFGGAGWTVDYSSADATLSFGSLSQILPSMNGIQGQQVTESGSGANSFALATYRNAWTQGTLQTQGLVATTTAPTPATSGQTVPAMADKLGRQIVVTSGPRDLTGESVLNSSSSSLVSFVAAQGAGIFTDITSLIITNESSTATIVSLSDGTTTRKYAIAANGGMVAPFNPPKKATSANTAWQVSNSAAVAVDYEAQWVENQ